MNAYLVVADSARARFFSWRGTSDPSLDGTPHLVELENVTNPEARVHDRDLFSERSPRNHSGGAGSTHAFDDHRDGSRKESQLRFVRLVAEQLSRRIAEQRPGRLLLVAERNILEDVRREVVPALPRDLEVVELAENLSKQSTNELQRALAQKGLLPAPASGPSFEQFVPRGQPVPDSSSRGPVTRRNGMS
jgi:protein required for attachment to host cells